MHMRAVSSPSGRVVGETSSTYARALNSSGVQIPRARRLVWAVKGNAPLDTAYKITSADGVNSIVGQVLPTLEDT